MITKKGHQSLHYIFLHQRQQIFELAAAWYKYVFAHDGAWYTPVQGLINIQFQSENQTSQAGIGLYFISIVLSEFRQKKIKQ